MYGESLFVNSVNLLGKKGVGGIRNLCTCSCTTSNIFAGFALISETCSNDYRKSPPPRNPVPIIRSAV